MKKIFLIASALMLSAFAFATEPGMYVKQGDNLIPLEEPKCSQPPQIGVGVGGFSTATEKYHLKGTASPVKISNKDKIVAVFAEKGQKTKKPAFKNGKTMENFVIGKLEVDKKKRIYDGGRAFAVFGLNVSRVGDEVNTIKMTIKQIDDLTYEITFPKDMEPGEYAFVASELVLTQKVFLGAFAFCIE